MKRCDTHQPKIPETNPAALHAIRKTVSPDQSTPDINPPRLTVATLTASHTNGLLPNSLIRKNTVNPAGSDIIAATTDAMMSARIRYKIILGRS